MKRKLWGMFLLLGIVFTAVFAVPMTANADEIECNGGILYYDINNEKVTITDCSSGMSGALIIPDTLDGYPVTSIGNSAFEGCSGLTTITIPDSVTYIGYGAFSGCRNLTEMNIPFIGKSRTATGSESTLGYIFGTKSYYGSYCAYQRYSSGSTASYYLPETLKKVTVTDDTTMPYGAFSGCSSLTTIAIPEGVTSIGNSAFEGCSGLTAITVPDSVTYIGSSAFEGCSRLTAITVPNSVTAISDYAFSGCSSLTSITILDSVTSIGNYAFSNCSRLTAITVPDSVTYIGSSAFEGCSRLTAITVLGSVTYIGESAFSGCSNLTSITIPGSVTYIGSSTFSGCSSLTEIEIPFVGKSRDATGSERILGYLFGTKSYYGSYCASQRYSQGNTVSYYLPKTLKKVTVTDDTTVPYGAFSGCGSLTTIAISDGVASIGRYDFYGCYGLTTIAIPDSVTSIDSDAFSKTAWYENQPDGLIYAGKVAYKYKGTMPSDTSIVLKEGTKIISNGVFSGCTGLNSITIPNSVTSIGNAAFYGCTGLTSITIPDSVTAIGNNVFYGCSSLEEVTVPYRGNTSIFSNCSATLKKVTITSVTQEIDAGIFSGCSKLTEIEIPFVGKSRTAMDSERTLGYLFGTNSYDGSYCAYQKYSLGGTASYYLPKTLKKVTVTDDTTVPYGAFSGCTNIYEIDIKEGPTAIENYAFSGCDLLKKATIPASVEAVAQYAFANSANLILYGDENSYIAAFSAKNKIPFVKINGGGTEGNITLVTENTVGDLTWKLYSNGLLELSGSGDMPTFRNSTKTPWYPYADTIREVEIKADTAIGSYSFFGMNSLEAVNITGNVTAIADDAFSSCPILNKIVIPSSVTSIGEYAFDECPNMTIYCKTGSAAEAFAKEHGIAVKSDAFDAVINQFGNNVVVTAKIPDDQVQKNVHAALYSSSGELLDYMIFPSEFSNNTVHFMFKKVQDSSYIKVFLWGGLETIIPLHDSIVLNVK